MVGPNIDIKSLVGAFCEIHAQKKKEELEETWDIVVDSIDSINERIKEKYYHSTDQENNNKEEGKK